METNEFSIREFRVNPRCYYCMKRLPNKNHS